MLKNLLSMFKAKESKKKIEPMFAKPKLEALEDRFMPSVTVTVNTLMDDPNGPISGYTTLRDAINQTNANGGGTINYSSSLLGQSSIYSALPTITKDVTITAPAWSAGHPVVNLTGGSGQYRAFTCDFGTNVEIDNFGISNFQINLSDGGAILSNGASLTLNYDDITYNGCSGNGGGVYSNAATTINNCDILHNSAAGMGGGLYLSTSSSYTSNIGTTYINNNTATANSSGGGGGVFFGGGTLNMLSGDQVNSNTAPFGGGMDIISGTVNLYGTVINGNNANASNGNGGGVFNNANLNIYKDIAGNDTFITNNSAGQYGGAMYLSDTSSTCFDGCSITGNTTVSGFGKGYYWVTGGKVTFIDLYDPQNP